MRPDAEQTIREALGRAILETGRVEDIDLSSLQLEKPREGAHGDLAANAAMVLASQVQMPPRILAEEILSHLSLPPELVSAVEVAGPGFINLRLSESYLRDEVNRINREGPAYGRPPSNVDQRIQLEFVSANPTGPLNVVSARAAAVGDSLARVLTWSGIEVETEFYVNDGGTQIDLFAASVKAAFLELAGFTSEHPEEGYRGAWVGGIARSLWRLLEALVDAAAGRRPVEPWLSWLADSGSADVTRMKSNWGKSPAESRVRDLADAVIGSIRDRRGARRLAQWWLAEEGGEHVFADDTDMDVAPVVRDLGHACAEALPFDTVSVAFMVAWQRRSLHEFGVDFAARPGSEDEPRGWFHEMQLYERGLIDETLELLKLKTDLVYEADEALWLATSRYGDDEDRVLVRRDGRPTYFLTDIAYHRDKMRRGYDRVIDIWGPDHHGHVARMKAAVRALDADPGWLEVVIAQQVNVLREGKPVKMSKRAGEIISLADLVAEAGRDTSRFFFLMRRTSSHLDFDLDLARKTSEENPVYYVQYAFARISSIYEFAKQRNISGGDSADLSRLTTPEELRVMRDLVRFPGEVRAAARTLEPHRLTTYLQELAQGFHKFYTVHRVVSEDEQLSRARLALVDATRIILEAGMDLAGVRPPTERM